jgi:hypothetical protein
MRMLIALIAAANVMVGSAFAEGRDPIGEDAYYQLDKNSQRTSNMIKDGYFTTQVSGVSENAASPSFDVNLVYHFDIAFMGVQEGTRDVVIEQKYFTEAFLQEIRLSGQYETADFKVKHMGYASVVNLDRTRYENCDKLLFYDIKTTSTNPVAQLLLAVAEANLISRGGNIGPDPEIENLKILTHVKYGIPVLGAVKIDMSGVVQGMNVKAGGDYLPTP